MRTTVKQLYAIVNSQGEVLMTLGGAIVYLCKSTANRMLNYVGNTEASLKLIYNSENKDNILPIDSMEAEINLLRNIIKTQKGQFEELYNILRNSRYKEAFQFVKNIHDAEQKREVTQWN